MDVSWLGRALRCRRRSAARAPPSPPAAAPVLNGIAASAATNFAVTVTIIAFGTFRNSKGGAKSRFPVYQLFTNVPGWDILLALFSQLLLIFLRKVHPPTYISVKVIDNILKCIE